MPADRHYRDSNPEHNPEQFKNSAEQQFRRVIRDAIRRCPDFSKGQRDVTLAVVNHWFHHRAKGAIHPGRKKISKKADVSMRTVASTFAMLRAAQVMIPVANLKGGYGTATRYKVDLVALMVLTGCDFLDLISPDLRVQNCTVAQSKIARLYSAKIAHGIIGTYKGSTEANVEARSSSSNDGENFDV